MVTTFYERLVEKLDGEIEVARGSLESCSLEGVRTIRAKIAGIRFAKMIIDQTFDEMKETEFTREEFFE